MNKLVAPLLIVLVSACDGGVEPQAAPLEPPAPPYAPAPEEMPVVDKVPPAPAEVEAPAAEPAAPEKKNKKVTGKKKKTGYPTLATRKALESILQTDGSAAGASGST